VQQEEYEDEEFPFIGRKSSHQVYRTRPNSSTSQNIKSEQAKNSKILIQNQKEELIDKIKSKANLGQSQPISKLDKMIPP